MKIFSSSSNYDINLNSSEFEETVQILSQDVEEIIETGTFNGLGSTTVFAKTGKPLTTIESCFDHFRQAVFNLKDFTNVKLLWGSSLNVKEMTEFIDADDIYESDMVLSKSIAVDGSSEGPQSFYKQEIMGFNTNPPTKQDLLIELINNDKKQLVFLDSAGGVGYLEFQKFMTLEDSKRKNKILLLDDVSHVKHYRSVVFLKQNKYNVVVSKNKRFAYCIF